MKDIFIVDYIDLLKYNQMDVELYNDIAERYETGIKIFERRRKLKKILGKIKL